MQIQRRKCHKTPHHKWRLWPIPRQNKYIEVHDYNGLYVSRCSCLFFFLCMSCVYVSMVVCLLHRLCVCVCLSVCPTFKDLFLIGPTLCICLSTFWFVHVYLSVCLRFGLHFRLSNYRSEVDADRATCIWSSIYLWPASSAGWGPPIRSQVFQLRRQVQLRPLPRLLRFRSRTQTDERLSQFKT